MTTENKQSDWSTVRAKLAEWRDYPGLVEPERDELIATLAALARLEAQAEAREKRIAELEGEVANLKDRLRDGDSLLSEILRLAAHLNKQGQSFLTLGHENRIRKFLCLLPAEYPGAGAVVPTDGPLNDLPGPDWICPHCQWTNFAIREICRNCGFDSGQVSEGAYFGPKPRGPAVVPDSTGQTPLTHAMSDAEARKRGLAEVMKDFHAMRHRAESAEADRDKWLRLLQERTIAKEALSDRAEAAEAERDLAEAVFQMNRILSWESDNPGRTGYARNIATAFVAKHRKPNAE